MGSCYQTVLSSSQCNMIFKVLIANLLGLLYLNGALGHGFMYYPTTWLSKSEIIPINGLKNALFGTKYPLPDEICKGQIWPDGECSSSAFVKGWTTDWFTNDTRIPGEGESMPPQMYGVGSGGFPLPYWMAKNPWTQPGTAPMFGEGCGVNGGNPNGCDLDCGDSCPFGTCCGGGWKSGPPRYWRPGCGGYTGGKSAFEHYEDGLFGETFTTTWTRGNTEAVYWTDMAAHEGGYAYRLCKIPLGGVTQITEECFNEGHLSFSGNTNWVYANMHPWSKHDYSQWQEVPAVRTTEGTFPPGSEWTKVNVAGKNWAYKDYVNVPEDIEPGTYILSFRWDCQKSPQIWSNCATIEVV